MAPTTVCTRLHTDSVDMGVGRRRLSLDSWVCLPILWPGRIATTTSPPGSSLKEVKTVSLEPEAQLETPTTPKSKEHRIPDVDVTFCPPAPRKPRAMARRRQRVQPTSFFNSPDFENFIAQHKVPVNSWRRTWDLFTHSCTGKRWMLSTIRGVVVNSVFITLGIFFCTNKRVGACCTLFLVSSPRMCNVCNFW